MTTTQHRNPFPQLRDAVESALATHGTPTAEVFYSLTGTNALILSGGDFDATTMVNIQLHNELDGTTTVTASMIHIDHSVTGEAPSWTPLPIPSVERKVLYSRTVNTSPGVALVSVNETTLCLDCLAKPSMREHSLVAWRDAEDVDEDYMGSSFYPVDNGDARCIGCLALGVPSTANCPPEELAKIRGLSPNGFADWLSDHLKSDLSLAEAEDPGRSLSDHLDDLKRRITALQSGDIAVKVRSLPMIPGSGA